MFTYRWMQLVLASVVATFAASTEIRAAEPEGTTTGIVVSRGETWLGLRAEGADDTAVLMPYWRGGLPKDGGGFDKDMLAKIKSLVPGSKVKVGWAQDEHMRLVSVEVLAVPEKEKVETANAGEKPAGDEKKLAALDDKRSLEERRLAEKKLAEDRAKEKAKAEERARTPDKTGFILGTLIAKYEKGPEWIDVRNENETMHFVPRWIGGLPADGGGRDPEIVHRMKKIKTGTVVRVEWVLQDEKYRATKISVIDK